MTLLNISPREYQQKIFEIARERNTLIVLPTGLGKTLIALLLTIDRIKKFPGSKIVFLAPTRPLIEQHFNYYKKYLPELYAQLDLFTGSVKAEERKKIWQTCEIVFSTPQCVSNDLKKGLYNFEEVSLIIIDEAHRCLKNFDYTTALKFYRQQSKNPLIVGMTASPGHEGDKIRQICAHLDSKEVEIRTRDSPDVKVYLQELSYKKIEVPFPKEFLEIKILLKKIYDDKVDKIKTNFPQIGPVNKITLLKLQNTLASQMSSSNFSAMNGMSLTAQAIKISHAIELLETQTLTGLKNYFDNLLQQAQEKKSRAVQNLVKTLEFNAALISLQHLLAKSLEHPKIDALFESLRQEFVENPNSKIIIFTQFRDTAIAIQKKILELPQIRSAIFVGQAKKKDAGLTQKEQKAIIEQFKTGEVNTLIATSIGEEGLDIPEVNAVVFYEPIPSAIRRIQRAGRTARLAPGKIIMLVTKDTRDEINLFAASAREKKMHSVIERVKRELKEQKTPIGLGKFI